MHIEDVLLQLYAFSQSVNGRNAGRVCGVVSLFVEARSQVWGHVTQYFG